MGKPVNIFLTTTRDISEGQVVLFWWHFYTTVQPRFRSLKLKRNAGDRGKSEKLVDKHLLMASLRTSASDFFRVFPQLEKLGAPSAQGLRKVLRERAQKCRGALACPTSY